MVDEGLPPENGKTDSSARRTGKNKRRTSEVFSENDTTKASKASTSKRAFEVFEDTRPDKQPPPLPESVSGQSKRNNDTVAEVAAEASTQWRLRFVCWAMLSIVVGIIFVELARAYEYFYNLWPGLGVLWLGWLGVVAVGIGLVWRHSVRDARSLRRADAFREMVEAHLIGHNFGNTKPLQIQLTQFYDGMPQATLWAEAIRTVPDSANDNEIVQHLERSFVAKLDQQVIEKISASASRNGVMIALSPWPLLDGILCFSNCMKMMAEIAQVYGLRPSLSMRFQLMRRILSALMLSSGTESLMDNLIEEGSLATLSSVSLRAGQGIGVGVYTARLGCFAMVACRPFPFDQCTQPNTRDFVVSLVNKLRGR